jgi:hypothetical protein
VVGEREPARGGSGASDSSVRADAPQLHVDDVHDRLDEALQLNRRNWMEPGDRSLRRHCGDACTSVPAPHGISPEPFEQQTAPQSSLWAHKPDRYQQGRKKEEPDHPEVDEEFQHAVQVWTVGNLNALADITDDTKLIFSSAAKLRSTEWEPDYAPWGLAASTSQSFLAASRQCMLAARLGHSPSTCSTGCAPPGPDPPGFEFLQ